MQILALMILVVLTSAVVLLLVQTGIVSVKADMDDVPILNTEFIPIERSGELVINEIVFCSLVDEMLSCINPLDDFGQGDHFYIHTTVQSSPQNGQIMLVRNYRLVGPEGFSLMEFDAKDNYYFELASKEKETITFADYVATLPDFDDGEYTLDITIENPLLNKKIITTKKFVIETYYGGIDYIIE